VDHTKHLSSYLALHGKNLNYVSVEAILIVDHTKHLSSCTLHWQES